MPAMAPTGGRYGGGTWTFIAGFSAAKLGDAEAAERAAAQLRAAAEQSEAGGNAYAAKHPAILAKEVAAVAAWARSQKDDAVRLAREAADIELTMDAPSGPPDPIKPAVELYADLLLEAGRAKEAAATYEQQLLRTPNRTPSVKGLARAKERAGMTTTSASR
jgi:hypothetical protein